MYKKIQKRVFEIIEKGSKNDWASRIFDLFIMTLISLNVCSVFVETFDISDRLSASLKNLEIFSIVVFTIEYALRIWTAPCMFPKKRAGQARLRYVFTFMSLVDLLSILPFYIPFIISIDLRVLRALRMFRLFRLMKFNRYTKAMTNVLEVLKLKAMELFSSVFIVAILMLISSALMYSIEGEAQPEAFQNAFSGLWWAIATFTTVGYGDIYPITAAGKILGGVVALLGIGLLAVPAGIVSAGFMELNAREMAKVDPDASDLKKELDKLKKQVVLVEKLLEEEKSKN